MNPTRPLAALLLGLAACAPVPEIPPATPQPPDLGAPAAIACRAAIARDAGVREADVTVTETASTSSGVAVRAGVVGGPGPWACLAEPGGKVLEVGYSGIEVPG
jgi:hypothetical protein